MDESYFMEFLGQERYWWTYVIQQPSMAVRQVLFQCQQWVTGWRGSCEPVVTSEVA